jgi:hypothetical protein
MNCEEARRAMEEAFDLDAPLESSALAHTVCCARCAGYAQELQRLRGMLEEAPAAPAGLAFRIRQRVAQEEQQSVSRRMLVPLFLVGAAVFVVSLWRVVDASLLDASQLTLPSFVEFVERSLNQFNAAFSAEAWTSLAQGVFHDVQELLTRMRVQFFAQLPSTSLYAAAAAATVLLTLFNLLEARFARTRRE